MPGERERDPGDPGRRPVGEVGEQLQQEAEEAGGEDREGDGDEVRRRTDAVGGADPGREHESPGWGAATGEDNPPEPGEPG